MKKLAISITGKTTLDLENSILEVLRLISNGNTSGFDSNESGQYTFEVESRTEPSAFPEEFYKGHWYLDLETSQLYIVPNSQYAIAEIIGADDEKLELLNTIYRETPFDKINPLLIAEKLHLEIVIDALKRFDPDEEFYYVA
ncbi:hypothetical protein [Iodobacter fluviatilis]|uniref:Uncharacterized protein n=1 Tax=Iodobacter fluviatilis TaxID=537 RepID=A0A377Q5R8_9NEIS|nr:hypothetical protein [Iodobacter fluviatilis]TCU84595.1 hypothetical protein EV682_109120 [Iodobacter fluviatilis]STQ90060.1 Uncharacterised protein [Iodobacter fluviatilis]